MSAAGPATEPAPAPGPAPAPAPDRGAGPTSLLPAPDAPARSALIPGLPETFKIRLGGAEIEIPLADPIGGAHGTVKVDLAAHGVAIPGVRFQTLTLTFTAAAGVTSGTLQGQIDAPFVSGDATLSIDAQGNVSGGGTGKITVAVLGNPLVTFSYLDNTWAGAVDVETGNLKLPIPGVVVEEGKAHVSVSGAHVDGSLSAKFHHAALGAGTIGVALKDGGVSGKGSFDLTLPLLSGTHGDIAVDNEGVSATVALKAADVKPPVPNLTIQDLNGQIQLDHGKLAGSFGLSAAYAGLATATIANVGIGPTGFTGAKGTIVLTAPALAGSEGDFAISAQGKPSGRVLLDGKKLPIKGLTDGKLLVVLREDGGVDVSGSGRLTIGPVGGGDLSVSYEKGVLSIAAEVDLRIPPLHPVTGHLEYKDGEFGGDITTGVTVGPLSGDVLLRYHDHVFSGEGRLAYRHGRFDGSVLVRVDEKGKISGDGQATFKLADWLTGTIGLVVYPDLAVDVHGELVFPADVTLFPAWKFEKNFFSFEQDFPLWGITIPAVGSLGLVASVHASAGFRAALGPGVLRNIKAVGEVSTRKDTEPTFQISAELNIPAGAEIVLVVGGGIALAAVIAKVEGGIDLNGIAGVYGAITLSPTFAYRHGKYELQGDALLQAAAQLVARVNAYARVVAGIGFLSGEVWRKDWQLAEWRFDTGWNVGLKASIAYVLGEPFVPQISYETVPVDPKALIKAAIPNSGDPVSAPPAPPAAAQAKVAGPGAAAAPPAPPKPPAAALPGAAAPGAAKAAPDGAPGAPPAQKATVAVEPPAGEAAPDDERSVDDTYLTYVYENVKSLLPRKKDATAPADSELVRQAHARIERGLPPVPEHDSKRPGEPAQDHATPSSPAERDLRRRETVEPARGQGGTSSPSEHELTERRRLVAEATPPVPGDGRSTGKPLAAGVHTEMERVFGEDLSHVRVHTGDAAAKGAKQIGAEAYTAGKEIYLGGNRSADGGHEELIAHELVHVIQQAGDGTASVGRPTSEVEHEAEEAAKKVKAGRKPKPIKRRRGEAGLHRKAADDDKGQKVDAMAHVPFTPEMWDKLKGDKKLLENPEFKKKVAELESKSAITAKAGSQVFDPQLNAFTKRGRVPMRFPDFDSLPHKSVTGEQQIKLGSTFVRAGGIREDDQQSTLADMIKSLSSEDAAKGFSQSPSGRFIPTQDNAWEAYQKTDVWKSADQRHSNLEQGFDEAQATTASLWNLTLTRQGFNKLWLLDFAYFGAAKESERGEWRNVKAKTAEAADGSTGAAVLKSDYQAHHVIPLWLSGASGGDNLDNLAPWHKDAHQTNHSKHHVAVDPKVTKATAVKDYREFNPDTPFLITEFFQGTKKPKSGPNVKVKDGKWATADAPVWEGPP